MKEITRFTRIKPSTEITMNSVISFLICPTGAIHVKNVKKLFFASKLSIRY